MRTKKLSSYNTDNHFKVSFKYTVFNSVFKFDLEKKTMHLHENDFK